MQIGLSLVTPNLEAILVPKTVMKNACYYIFNHILITFQVVNNYIFMTYR